MSPTPDGRTDPRFARALLQREDAFQRKLSKWEVPDDPCIDWPNDYLYLLEAGNCGRGCGGSFPVGY